MIIHMDIANNTASTTNSVTIKSKTNPWVSTTDLNFTYGSIYTVPFVVNMKSILEQYVSFSIRLYMSAKYVD